MNFGATAVIHDQELTILLVAPDVLFQATDGRLLFKVCGGG